MGSRWPYPPSLKDASSPLLLCKILEFRDRSYPASHVRKSFLKNWWRALRVMSCNNGRRITVLDCPRYLGTALVFSTRADVENYAEVQRVRLQASIIL